jgi:hypothetical protein
MGTSRGLGMMVNPAVETNKNEDHGMAGMSRTKREQLWGTSS